MKLESILPIVQIFGGLIGAVGGVLGLIAWRRTQKIQQYQLAEIVSKKTNKALQDSLFEKLITSAGYEVMSTYWKPEPGSEDFQLMEGLLERGKLFRNQIGGFQLRRDPE